MKKFWTHRFIVILIAALVPFMVPAQETCDESCSVGGGTEPTFKVVSPVGRQTVEMIDMAPRLNTLEGKTIALVGGSFMASVTHMELKRLILKHYPTATVLVLDEIGAAGLFPAPGVTRKSVADFERRLRERSVDAVVSGNGGCGICTPKETGSCIAAERMGIPAVMVAAPGFDKQARTTARNSGVPALRVAVYPGAFASHTREQLQQNTRQALWPQVVAALTTPITQQELTSQVDKEEAGDVRAVVCDAPLDSVNRLFAEMRWSDGLPIVPPTVDKVQEFLRYTACPWDREVAVLSPARRSTLAWHVAVNGVMAGCKPEHMPLLIALTRAMGDPNFRRTLGSTHAWVPYCWLNGPVARQLGFDHGQGQINEENNVALGRFLNLAMMNLAGYYVKQDRMGTFGYPVSWCLAEDEEACRRVGWQPFHVRQGFGTQQSTVTVCSTLLWGNNMAPATTDGERIMQLLAWDITQRCQLALGSGMQYTFRTILLTEEVAKHLQETYGSAGALEDALVATARRPLYERAFANYYANPGSAFDPSRVSLNQYCRRLEREEDAAATPMPEWYASDDQDIVTIPTMRKGETAFLVTGDASRNKIQTMPGGGLATVAVELPPDWDALMVQKGYPSLAQVALQGANVPAGEVDPQNAPVRTDYHDIHRNRNRHHRAPTHESPRQR